MIVEDGDGLGGEGGGCDFSLFSTSTTMTIAAAAVYHCGDEAEEWLKTWWRVASAV
jgi:hypothetical protein